MAPVGAYSECESSQNLPISSITGQNLQTFLVSSKTRTRDKYRVVYSNFQRLELEKEYRFNKYITIRR